MNKKWGFKRPRSLTVSKEGVEISKMNLSNNAWPPITGDLENQNNENLDNGRKIQTASNKMIANSNPKREFSGIISSILKETRLLKWCKRENRLASRGKDYPQTDCQEKIFKKVLESPYLRKKTIFSKLKNSSKIPQLQSLSVVAKDEDGKEPKKPEFEEGEEIPSQSADEISTVPPIPVLKTPRRVQTSPKWKKRNKSQKKDFAHVVKAFGATYAGNQRQPIEKDDIMNCDQYVFKESPYYGNEAQIMRASTEDNNLSSLMKDFESHANDNDLRSCLSTANRSKRYYKMYNVNQIANWNKIGYAKCELHASRMRKRFENTIKHRQIKSMDENEPITPVSSKYSQVLSFQGRTKEDDPSQYDFQFESNQPQTQAHNHRKKGEKQKTEPFMEFDIDIIERSQIELNSEAHSSFIEKNPKKSSTPLNLSNTSSPSKPNNHPSEPAQSKSHSSSQHKKATKTDKDKEITPNHSKTQKNSISEILATPNHTYPENEAKHPLFLKKKKAFGRKRSLETTTHTKRSPKTGCAASAGGIGEKRNMRTIDLDRGDSAKKREGGFVIRKSKKKNKGNRSRSPKARNMNQLENACRNRNGGIRLLIQKRRENYAFNHSLQLYQPANRGKQLWNFSNTNQRLNPLNKSMQSPKQINKRHSLFKKLMNFDTSHQFYELNRKLAQCNNMKYLQRKLKPKKRVIFQ